MTFKTQTTCPFFREKHLSLLLTLFPTTSHTLWSPIGSHYECAYSPVPVTNVQQILSDEPTVTQRERAAFKYLRCSSCMEEDNDGHRTVPSPTATMASICSSMLVFSTVLLLNVLALTSYLRITVISLEKQGLCKVSKRKGPSARGKEWKTHLKKQTKLASAVTVHWACQTCLLQLRNNGEWNNVLIFNQKILLEMALIARN